MRQDLPHLALFKIFSVRAAAELERMLLKQKLDAGIAAMQDGRRRRPRHGVALPSR